MHRSDEKGHKSGPEHAVKQIKRHLQRRWERTSSCSARTTDDDDDDDDKHGSILSNFHFFNQTQIHTSYYHAWTLPRYARWLRIFFVQSMVEIPPITTSAASILEVCGWGQSSSIEWGDGNHLTIYECKSYATVYCKIWGRHLTYNTRLERQYDPRKTL